MTKVIIFDWIGTLYERDRGLFPFSEKVLQELKLKYKLALLTLAKGGYDARKAQLESTGIMQYFDFVLIANKKEKEEYLRCMDKLDSEPENTIIVDDRTMRGIKAGNQIGCETYWIQKGDWSHEKPNEETGEPTHKINSVEDLLRFL